MSEQSEQSAQPEKSYTAYKIKTYLLPLKAGLLSHSSDHTHNTIKKKNTLSEKMK